MDLGGNVSYPNNPCKYQVAPLSFLSSLSPILLIFALYSPLSLFFIIDGGHLRHA